MADSRIENLPSIVAANVADGDMIVIDDVDADQAKSVTITEARKLLDAAVYRGSQTDSYILNQEDNTLGTGCNTATLTGAGTSEFPNKIGANGGIPAGSDNDPGWVADDTYTGAGAPAIVATIAGGYDNINNQVGGTISGGGHNMISYNSGGHSVVGGGSYNWCGGGRSYIGGGRANSVRDGSLNYIGGGEFNVTKTGNFNCIIGGRYNRSINAESSVTGGQYNGMQGKYSAMFGDANVASDESYYSLTFGRMVHNHIGGALAFSGRNIQFFGDAQAMSWCSSFRSTNFSTQYLTSMETGRYAYLLDNAVMTGAVHIQCMDEATGNVAAWYAHVVAKRYNDSGSSVTVTTTELADEITVTDPTIEISSWGALRVAISGKASTNLVWSARFDMTQVLIPMSESCTVDAGADTLTITTHEFQVGERVVLSGTTPPGGLAFATNYYIVSATGGTSTQVGGKVLKLSAEVGGDAIDITSTGTSVTIARS